MMYRIVLGSVFLVLSTLLMYGTGLAEQQAATRRFNYAEFHAKLVDSYPVTKKVNELINRDPDSYKRSVSQTYQTVGKFDPNDAAILSDHSYVALYSFYYMLANEGKLPDDVPIERLHLIANHPEVLLSDRNTAAFCYYWATNEHTSLITTLQAAPGRFAWFKLCEDSSFNQLFASIIAQATYEAILSESDVKASSETLNMLGLAWNDVIQVIYYQDVDEELRIRFWVISRSIISAARAQVPLSDAEEIEFYTSIHRIGGVSAINDFLRAAMIAQSHTDILRLAKHDPPMRDNINAFLSTYSQMTTQTQKSLENLLSDE